MGNYGQGPMWQNVEREHEHSNLLYLLNSVESALFGKSLKVDVRHVRCLASTTYLWGPLKKDHVAFVKLGFSLLCDGSSTSLEVLSKKIMRSCRWSEAHRKTL